MQDNKHRGKNIKIFDKIKIQHVQSGYRLHALDQQWKGGSYNQAVSCHKTRDQSDWFVVLKADTEDSQPVNGLSYHFLYGDSVLLSHVTSKKYLHVTSDFDSEVSKNLEVSLCENGEGGPNCDEDAWVVKNVGSSYDGYWRVGEQIKIESAVFGKPLCSHSRRLRQSGENEVFVRKTDQEKTKQNKNGQQKTIISNTDVWIVSELQPFLYTANLTDKKQPKKNQQTEQIDRLRKIRQQFMKKQPTNYNETQELLKLGNERLAQMQTAKKKVNQSEKKNSWWKICFCCCCPQRQDDYSTL